MSGRRVSRGRGAGQGALAATAQRRSMRRRAAPPAAHTALPARLARPTCAAADLSDVVMRVGLVETEVDLVDSLGVSARLRGSTGQRHGGAAARCAHVWGSAPWRHPLATRSCDTACHPCCAGRGCARHAARPAGVVRQRCHAAVLGGTGRFVLKANKLLTPQHVCRQGRAACLQPGVALASPGYRCRADGSAPAPAAPPPGAGRGCTAGAARRRLAVVGHWRRRGRRLCHRGRR